MDFDSLKKKNTTGTSSEEEKLSVEKHLLKSFLCLNDRFDFHGPEGAVSKLMLTDYGNYQEQLMFEALFLTKVDRLFADSTREYRREDTVPNIVREIEQYDYIGQLLTAWGFVGAFNEEGVVDINVLFGNGYTSKDLWESRGGAIQNILCESGYHYIIFSK
jgi:hypothetical protein